MTAVPVATGRGVSPVWIVDKACEFRELVTDVGRDLGLSLLALDATQASAVVGRAVQPHGVLLDDESLDGVADTGAVRALFGAERVVICTAQPSSDLAPELARDPRVRVLAKPFGLPALEDALRWLAGFRAADALSSGRRTARASTAPASAT